MIALLLTLLPLAAEAPEPRLSLPITDDVSAWRETGFRVALGYSFDVVAGLGAAPSSAVHEAILRLGVRLDDRWSLSGTLRYGVLHGDAVGLRYSGTVEPVLHLSDGLSLAIGLGLAGFVVPDTGVEDFLFAGDQASSVSISGEGPRLRSCLGAGAIALARVEYQWLLSDLSAMGPLLQVEAQSTGCTQALNRSDPDTGESIVLRQRWQHFGVNMAWVFSWR